MKRILLIISITVLCAWNVAIADESFQLSPLSGCWEGKYPNRTYVEQWMEPAGDMMLGMSRSVREGKVLEYEFLQILKREDGTFYIARPSGQAKAEFRLISFENGKAIFENPSHDFPQRVIYHIKSPNDVAAWIEGMSKGELKKSEFPMTRVPCPGSK